MKSADRLTLIHARAQVDVTCWNARARYADVLGTLRAKGYTLAEIACELGVTRQAIADTLKRSR